MDNIRKFEDFINEELNFEETIEGCILMRDWYFYNIDDDIVYGADEKPIFNVHPPILFNISQNDVYINGSKINAEDDGLGYCFITFDLDNNSSNVLKNKNDIVNYLSDILVDVDENIDDYANDIQEGFDNIDDMRYILLHENKIIASTFDIIEEN